jgi:hypothetical protein
LFFTAISKLNFPLNPTNEGSGTNLTYLNDQPVLIPIELPSQSHISIGNTVLRFVPLCGDAFAWQDTEERAKD